MWDQWELCNQGYIVGPLRWGTNENCITRVTFRGPMRWKTNENCITRVTLGDQWAQGRKGYKGGPMRRGTNECCVTRITLGDQWEMGNQWELCNHGNRVHENRVDGARLGTNEMGDQWELCNHGRIGGPMRWGTNENCVIMVALGDQWDGEPMRTV